MWTVIYVAPSMTAAERLKELLTREGLLVNLRMAAVTAGPGSGSVEIMVPQAEAREAQAILVENLGRTRF